MAFPVVQAVTESVVATAATSHPVTLPASIASSDLVLILMDIGSTAATLNALTDWSEVLDENVANGLKILLYTGAGVPSNPTFTSSAATRSVSLAYRISGADKSITPQIGTTATGTSLTPDPPSVTPTGGITKDYLFIAFFGQALEEADDDTWANTPPTNYTPSPPRQKTAGTAGTNLGGLIASAERQLATGSAENPGTFAVDVSAAWRAQTIIVHPQATTSGAYEFALANPVTTPPNDDDHTVRVRAWASAGSGLLKVRLLQGATEIDAWTETLTGSAANYNHAVAPAAAANISNYNDLRLELVATTFTSATVRVSQVSFSVPEGAAGGDLVVQDALHGHAADNAALTQVHTLAVQDATHGHTADNVVLVQNSSLVVADALHGHTADNVVLTQGHVLTVAEARNTHTADNVALTQVHSLVVADATHGHTADNVALTQTHVLAVQDALHGHAADNVVLAAGGALVVQEATHGHTADNVALTQVHVLSVQDAAHGHTADNAAITKNSSLVVQDALHGHAADNVVLTQGHVLTVSETLHSHTADSVTLTQVHVLSVADALHGHAADNVTVTTVNALVVQETLHAHSADTVTVTQLHVLVVDDALHGHTADTVPRGDLEAIITCAIDGPATKAILLSGPAIMVVALKGPAVARRITGPAIEVLSLNGPAIEAVSVRGPAVSRVVDGPDIEAAPSVDAGPDTSRELIGPAMCPGG
ncbi:MAG: hypothetical protein K0Q89_115 [Thermomicrobiales bacterium]|jgi:hypothetical protein|nr:hypothetical protein [Thermomicrobiales bacterium]